MRCAELPFKVILALMISVDGEIVLTSKVTIAR